MRALLAWLAHTGLLSLLLDYLDKLYKLTDVPILYNLGLTDKLMIAKIADMFPE